MKKSYIKKLLKLYNDIYIILGIITGRYKHYVFINVDKENLVKIIEEKDEINFDIIYSGFVPYLYNKVIKMIADSKDDIDMMLDKAAFEAAAELESKNK